MAEVEAKLERKRIQERNEMIAKHHKSALRIQRWGRARLLILRAKRIVENVRAVMMSLTIQKCARRFLAPLS